VLLLLLPVLVAWASSSGCVGASTTSSSSSSSNAEWDLTQHASAIAEAKGEFFALQPDPANYGYDGLLDTIRAHDTPQLKDQVYLDWTVRTTCRKGSQTAPPNTQQQQSTTTTSM
jgi:hypothetical protein